jgi:hypothetical protein
VTLTLPEDVIGTLEGVDGDLSRAIVRTLSELTIGGRMPPPPAELSRYRNSAVIVIRPHPVLERIEGVGLVPLLDGRALISLDNGLTVADFELRLRDALDNDSLNPQERLAMASIVEILRSARSTRGVALESRNIIVLRSRQRRRSDGSQP